MAKHVRLLTDERKCCAGSHAGYAGAAIYYGGRTYHGADAGASRLNQLLVPH